VARRADRKRRAPWLGALIEKGALGQKSGAGFYANKGKQVLDPASGAYRDAGAKPDQAVQAILKIKNPAEKFAALRASDHPQAQFLWAIHRDVFHYAAVLLAEIADNARDVDFAVRWGFGWSLGPFEIWQAAGWKQVAAWIEEDLEAGGRVDRGGHRRRQGADGHAAAGLGRPNRGRAPAARFLLGGGKRL